MKILLSKQNFLNESLTLIDSTTTQSASVTASSGLTFEVDLFKMSLLSPLLRSIKESLSVPDSLNHLLDINIIFPDFSEEALTLLNESFIGLGSDMRVGMNLYEELQLLVNAFGISLYPSLSILEDQIESDINSNETENINKEIAVKDEPMVVDLTDIQEYEFVYEPACTYVVGTPNESLSNTKEGRTVDDASPELLVNNSTAQMIFTHSAEDGNEYRNELGKLMVSKAKTYNKKQMLSCIVCGFEKESSKKIFKHLDTKHTPHILHRCVLCFKNSKTNVLKSQRKFKKNVFETQVALKYHMVKLHGSFEAPVEDFTSAS